MLPYVDHRLAFYPAYFYYELSTYFSKSSAKPMLKLKQLCI